jgi:hypothetical protein
MKCRRYLDSAEFELMQITIEVFNFVFEFSICLHFPARISCFKDKVT